MSDTPYKITFVQPKAVIISHNPHALIRIEEAARTCYASKDKMLGQAMLYDPEFIMSCIRKGHESILEHENMTVDFYISRAMSHQLVRHRIAAYSQTSQRYVNYDNECEFIFPAFMQGWETVNWTEENKMLPQDSKEVVFMESCIAAAKAYKKLRESDTAPEDSRDILPNATLTVVRATYNFRQWRHVLKLRTEKHAQYPIRMVMRSVLAYLKAELPELVFDIPLILSDKDDGYYQKNDFVAYWYTKNLTEGYGNKIYTEWFDSSLLLDEDYKLK